MPLDKFVLIIVVVLVASGLTVAAAVYVSASLEVPGLGLSLLIPLSLCGYVVWRVVGDRVRSRDDSHYDKIER